MKKLIALCGKKRSGKSTAAEFIQAEIGPSCYRFAFGDAIKSQVAKIFGPYDEERKETLRPVYQSVGQAAKQLYGTRVWLDIVDDQLKRLKDVHAVIVIDDLRFPFEAEWVKSMGGLVWRVVRPETDFVYDPHVSETEIDLIEPDHLLHNNSTPDYHEKIRSLLKHNNLTH